MLRNDRRRQFHRRAEPRGAFTSPGSRLAILRGNPDFLDPVLGQLSWHSSVTGEPGSRCEPNRTGPDRTEPLISGRKETRSRCRLGTNRPLHAVNQSGPSHRSAGPRAHPVFIPAWLAGKPRHGGVVMRRRVSQHAGGRAAPWWTIIYCTLFIIGSTPRTSAVGINFGGTTRSRFAPDVL